MAVTIDARDDPLGHLPGSADEAWFDRCYFNLCSPAEDLMAVAGLGLYPNRQVADGYFCLAAAGSQRNVRMSTTGDPASLPLRVQVIDPLRRWRLSFGDAESGLWLDAEWSASCSPFGSGAIEVDHSAGPPTRFDHYYQPGTYSGTLAVDGRRYDLGGWFGQRDRSWGLRRIRDRLGLHLWGGASFPGGAFGVHYNQARDGSVAHCDGFVERAGRRRLVIELAHDLDLSADGELLRGTLELRTAGEAEPVAVSVEAVSRGIYMDGAGYGGWQGVRRGSAHVERDCSRLEDVSLRSLSTTLVDKLCDFEVDGAPGRGVFELALSRSSRYHYAPARISL